MSSTSTSSKTSRILGVLSVTFVSRPNDNLCISSNTNKDWIKRRASLTKLALVASPSMLCKYWTIDTRSWWSLFDNILIIKPIREHWFFGDSGNSTWMTLFSHYLQRIDMKNAKSDNESTSESKQESVPVFVSPIAKPLAGKSLEKKVFKLVKKGRLTWQWWIWLVIVCVAAKAKCTRRGVKEVVKSIRKNEKGWEEIQKDDWIEWWFLLRTLLLWMSFLTFLCYVRKRVFHISLLVQRCVFLLYCWLIGSLGRCCNYEASY